MHSSKIRRIQLFTKYTSNKSLVEAEDAILTGLTKNDDIAKILKDDELIAVLMNLKKHVTKLKSE